MLQFCTSNTSNFAIIGRLVNCKMDMLLFAALVETEPPEIDDLLIGENLGKDISSGELIGNSLQSGDLVAQVPDMESM